MKIVIELLLVMNLTGTVCFLSYLLLTRLADRYISAGFRYLALKLCLCLFIIPFPLIKLALFWKFVPQYHEWNGIYYRDVAHSILLTKDGISFPKFSINEQAFLIVWICILAVLLLYRLYRYLKFRHSILTGLSKDHEGQILLDTIKKEKKVHAHIQVYYCEADISPFTYGFFHPTLLLTGLVCEENIELVLRHELQHIKSHDFFFRIFALTVVYLNCFNPIVYLLFYELKEVQEMNCDEKMVRNFSPEERRKYGYILLDMTSKEQPFTAPVLCFSKMSKPFFKKRIQKIAAFTHMKKSVMYALFAILCLVSSIPVYAYSPRFSDFRSDTEPLPDGVDWISLEITPEGTHNSFVSEDEINFRYADSYIISENGSVMLLDGTQSLQANCQHTFEKGTQKVHLKKNIGCTVTVYSVVFCPKCALVKSRTYVSTTSYAVCHHSDSV